MKNRLFNRVMLFIMSIILGSCTLPIIVNGQTSSRSLPTKPKITFNKNVVDGGDIIQVTISFTDTMNREVPFTIQVTNGAMILAETVEDIMFTTNNKQKVIKSIKVNEDASEMDLLTNICVRNKKSILKFWVEAPVDEETFQVILKTDSVYSEYKTVISDKVEVVSGLTINAPEIVNDVDNFDVFGLVKYKGQSAPENSHMFLEIVNKDQEKPYFYEIQMVESIVNDEYKFSSIKLPSDYEDGDYIIKVYLWDDEQDKLIGYAKKEVKFVKEPQVLISAPEIVNDVDLFDIYGIVKYAGKSNSENSHVFLEIVNEDPEKPYFEEIQIAGAIVNDEYRFSSIKLSSDYEDGDYLIRMYLWDDNEDEMIAYAEKKIKFIKKLKDNVMEN